MSDQKIKRASEESHVIAAKNLADIMVKEGVKRADFLEQYSRSLGFGSWNAYRESGAPMLAIPAENGESIRMVPGPFPVPTENFIRLAEAAINRATKAGYSCDYSSPTVISTTLNNFLTLSSAARGLILSPDVRHRGFRFVENIPDDLVILTVMPKLANFSGLIVLDLPGTSEHHVAQLAAAAPKAIILHHAMKGRKRHPTPLLGRNLGLAFSDDMWSARMWAMLEAFARAGVPYDTRNVPKIDDLDYDNPVMKIFLDTIPGYEPFNRYMQNQKSKEQYGFLTMQTHPRSY